MPKNSCIMQIWAESGKSALPICNYSQILYQFLTFTQNLKRSRGGGLPRLFCVSRQRLNSRKPLLSRINYHRRSKFTEKFYIVHRRGIHGVSRDLSIFYAIFIFCQQYKPLHRRMVLHKNLFDQKGFHRL